MSDFRLMNAEWSELFSRAIDQRARELVSNWKSQAVYVEADQVETIRRCVVLFDFDDGSTAIGVINAGGRMVYSSISDDGEVSTDENCKLSDYFGMASWVRVMFRFPEKQVTN